VEASHPNVEVGQQVGEVGKPVRRPACYIKTRPRLTPRQVPGGFIDLQKAEKNLQEQLEEEKLEEKLKKTEDGRAV
jgi:hypothetical protein